MNDPAVFRSMFLSAENGPGPWLGAVSDRSVRVWLRSPEPGPVRATLRVASAAVAEMDLLPSVEHDCIAVAELTAKRSYAGRPFELDVAGVTLKGSMAPEAVEAAPFTFLMGSCNQPFIYRERRAELGPANRIYRPMSETMARRQVKFSLLVGDQAYADGVEGLSVPDWVGDNDAVSDEDLLTHYRHVYRSYLGHSGLAGILSQAPSYLIWDDHEIYDCWGSHDKPSALERRLFRAARQAYVEYEHSRNPGATLEDKAPLHYHFWYGDVGFFVLDLRGQREYAEARLLDEDQWQALQGFLTEAAARDARTVFIAASIPVVHFSPFMASVTSHLPTRKAALSRDRWDSAALMPHRHRLLSLLFNWQTGAEGRKVTLLSGDVHAAAAFRVRQRGGRGVITQWTSSAMCTPSTLGHALANRFGTAFASLGDPDCDSELKGLEPQNNFGIVDVLPRPGRPGHTARFEVFRYDPKSGGLRQSFSDEV